MKVGMYNKLLVLGLLMVPVAVSAVMAEPQTMGFADFEKIMKQDMDFVNKIISGIENKIDSLYTLIGKRVDKKVSDYILGIRKNFVFHPFYTSAIDISEPDATTHSKEIQYLRSGLTKKRARIDEFEKTILGIAQLYGITASQWESAYPEISW